MKPSTWVRLGRSEVLVTRLGLGTLPIGEINAPVADDEALALVRRSFESGVRYFDTAPQYGIGLAERRLSHVLPTLPRDEFVLSTKVGRLVRPVTIGTKVVEVIRESIDNRDMSRFTRSANVAVQRLRARGRSRPVGAAPTPVDAPERGLGIVTDYSHDGVLRSIEESLARLRLDRIDIALIHDPDFHYEQALTGAYRALDRLRSEGTVRAIGVGMNQSAMLARFAREADFDCFLVAGRYSLLDQSAAVDLLPLAQERGIGIIVGGVYNSGILADPRPGAHYDYKAASGAKVEAALRIKTICDRFAVPLKAAAVQFPLGNPAVTSVLVGSRSRAEFDENEAMSRHPIPDDLWAELRDHGLIAEGVPTP